METGPEPLRDSIRESTARIKGYFTCRSAVDTKNFTGPSLLEAKVLIERWRMEYNTIRPHSSLGYRPPAPEAIQPWLNSARRSLPIKNLLNKNDMLNPAIPGWAKKPAKRWTFMIVFRKHSGSELVSFLDGIRGYCHGGQKSGTEAVVGGCTVFFGAIGLGNDLGSPGRQHRDQLDRCDDVRIWHVFAEVSVVAAV